MEQFLALVIIAGIIIITAIILVGALIQKYSDDEDLISARVQRAINRED